MEKAWWQGPRTGWKTGGHGWLRGVPVVRVGAEVGGDWGTGTDGLLGQVRAGEQGAEGTFHPVSIELMASCAHKISYVGEDVLGHGLPC